MDPISLIKVPGDLMDAALNHIEGLGEGLADETEAPDPKIVVRSVILSALDYLADDDIQRAMSDRLGDLLPVDPYERRNAVAEIVGQVAYQLGVTP